MSMWEVVLSVSSCAAVGSAITLTDSATAGRSSLISRSRGIEVRTSSVLWTGAKPWTSTCSSYGLKGTLKKWKLPSRPVVASALNPEMSLRS